MHGLACVCACCLCVCNGNRTTNVSSLIFERLYWPITVCSLIEGSALLCTLDPVQSAVSHDRTPPV